MKPVLLSSLLKRFTRLSGVTTALFDGEECLIVHSPADTSVDWTKEIRNALRKEKSDPSYLADSQLLLYGRIIDHESGMDIFIGPASYNKLSANQIHAVLLEKNIPISADTIEECETYFSSLTEYDTGGFLNLLSLLDGFINERNILLDTMDEQFSLQSIREDAVDSEQEQFENDWNTVEPENNYEERLLYYVEQGAVEEIRNMESFQGVVPNMGATSLRHYKNALIVLNSLCVRAAVKGGADAKGAYQYSDVILHRIEDCTSTGQILRLFESSPIPETYASMVSETFFPEVSHPKIREALHYIRKNYEKRLSVGEIAEELGMSKEYLSSLFHKETGTTIPSFITSMKIRQAKALLLYTDLTILQISEILSFSSQSYFQNQFKKSTGVTPAVYRETRH